MNGKATPAETKSLVKNTNGEAAHGDFSYNRIVCILLYLSGHLQPDIAYAVNFVACCMFCPRHFHDLALKRIGRHPKAAFS